MKLPSTRNTWTLHTSLFHVECDLSELTYFPRFMGPALPDAMALGVEFEQVSWQVHCAVIIFSVQSDKAVQIVAATFVTSLTSKDTCNGI